MNERIRELWSQAGGHYNSGNQHTWPGYTIDDPEKFAELIMRECAELAKIKAFIIMQKAEEYAADKEEMINATSAAFHLEILEQEIRKHFGVEE
tara:strand:+ start:647 stop:928 length:282 start_codon:yes stop_codon:yes gene_type:complete